MCAAKRPCSSENVGEVAVCLFPTIPWIVKHTTPDATTHPTPRTPSTSNSRKFTNEWVFTKYLPFDEQMLDKYLFDILFG